MVVEEFYTNIASYAYGTQTGIVTVECSARQKPRKLKVTFMDKGMPYNPLEYEDPDISVPIEERQIGGNGILMEKKMDEKKIIRAMTRIDAINAPKLEVQLKEAVGTEQGRHIVLDMEDTVYICSVGLRVLLVIQKQLRRSEGSMVITNVKPPIMEIFEVTGFSGVFTFQ